MGCLFLLLIPLTHAAIVFCADSDDLEDEIYVMDDAGNNIRRLTQNALSEYTPRWAPDGKKIGFVRNNLEKKEGFETDLFLMDPNGENVKNITIKSGSGRTRYHFCPGWAKDRICQ